MARKYSRGRTAAKPAGIHARGALQLLHVGIKGSHRAAVSGGKDGLSCGSCGQAESFAAAPPFLQHATALQASVQRILASAVTSPIRTEALTAGTALPGLARNGLSPGTSAPGESGASIAVSASSGQRRKRTSYSPAAATLTFQ